MQTYNNISKCYKPYSSSLRAFKKQSQMLIFQHSLPHKKRRITKGEVRIQNAMIDVKEEMENKPQHLNASAPKQDIVLLHSGCTKCSSSATMQHHSGLITWSHNLKSPLCTPMVEHFLCAHYQWITLSWSRGVEIPRQVGDPVCQKPFAWKGACWPFESWVEVCGANISFFMFKS